MIKHTQRLRVDPHYEYCSKSADRVEFGLEWKVHLRSNFCAMLNWIASPDSQTHCDKRLRKEISEEKNQSIKIMLQSFYNGYGRIYARRFCKRATGYDMHAHDFQRQGPF